MKIKLLSAALICSLAFNIAFLSKHPAIRELICKKPAIHHLVDKKTRTQMRTARRDYRIQRRKFFLALTNENVTVNQLDSLQASLLKAQLNMEKTLTTHLLQLREEVGANEMRHCMPHFANPKQQPQKRNEKRRRP